MCRVPSLQIPRCSRNREFCFAKLGQLLLMSRLHWWTMMCAFCFRHRQFCPTRTHMKFASVRPVDLPWDSIMQISFWRNHSHSTTDAQTRMPVCIFCTFHWLWNTQHSHLRLAFGLDQFWHFERNRGVVAFARRCESRRPVGRLWVSAILGMSICNAFLCWWKIRHSITEFECQ